MHLYIYDIGVIASELKTDNLLLMIHILNVCFCFWSKKKKKLEYFNATQDFSKY